MPADRRRISGGHSLQVYSHRGPNLFNARKLTVFQDQGADIDPPAVQ
jgi:hypothetical protein